MSSTIGTFSTAQLDDAASFPERILALAQAAEDQDRYCRTCMDAFMAVLRPDESFTWTLNAVTPSDYRFVVYEKGLLFFGTSYQQRVPFGDFRGSAWRVAVLLPQLWLMLLKKREADLGVEQARLETARTAAAPFLPAFHYGQDQPPSAP